ncbi:hypothetical protein CY35_19G086700 [Sphagnum magellanicum]|nr:hypothetical protein CY35_19G086700 [Sphagnum magellanicum]
MKVMTHLLWNISVSTMIVLLSNPHIATVGVMHRALATSLEIRMICAAFMFMMMIVSSSRLCILGTQHQWVLKWTIKESGNSSQCGKICFKPPSIHTHQPRVLAARRRLSNLSDPCNFFLDQSI